MKCPTCSSTLEQKQGVKKLCAQIGNPEIAIYEAKDPLFCGSCNDYYLSTEQIVKAIVQIKGYSEGSKAPIQPGIYS